MSADLLRLFADGDPEALLTLGGAAVLLIAVCSYALGRHTATDHAYSRGYEQGRRHASWDEALDAPSQKLSQRAVSDHLNREWQRLEKEVRER